MATRPFLSLSRVIFLPQLTLRNPQIIMRARMQRGAVKVASLLANHRTRKEIHEVRVGKEKFMGSRISRRRFLRTAAGVATAMQLRSIGEPPSEGFRRDEHSTTLANDSDRIVDMHVHFDEKNPNFIHDLIALAERIHLMACVLTPYSHRA